MRKVSRARSRQTTPWDSREELSPIQHFLQMHYKAHYEARHPQLTEIGEVELINSFVPSKCPICGAKDFRKRSHTSNGVQRYQCLSCKKSFLPTTNTIFDEHRISISEWLEYCLNLFRYVSINAASWNNKNAWTTSRFWLEKLFLTLRGIQDDIVLSDVVWLDETYYPVINSDTTLTSDGKKLRGISRNQLCIGVATDKAQILCFFEGNGRPSKMKTFRAFKDHIVPGSIIIHDEDNTHSKLVDVLGLKSKTYLSKDMKGIPDELNPLAPVNNVHDKLKKFLNAHSGFNRKYLQDYMNLYVFVANPPHDPLEKVEKIINLAFENPKKLRYREFYSVNTNKREPLCK